MTCSGMLGRLVLVFLRSVLQLVVSAYVVPRSLILVTLKMDAIQSSETSVLTISTQRNIPENRILLSHIRQSLTFYVALTDWVL
jgi:hypothetical protein